MPRQWFIKTHNGQHGPISSRRLAKLARSGSLTRNTGVSPDGETWVKAKKISGLVFPTDENVPNEQHKAKGKIKTKGQGKGWYIQTKNGVHGPVRSRKLKRLAKKGRITPNVAISRDQKRWIKAKRIPGIEFPDQILVTPAPKPRPKVALPVIQELPIAGHLPTLEDLPRRKREPVALPVVDELPIIGPVPIITDLPTRYSLPFPLPVVDDLPIAGPVPDLADLPPRKRDPVALPVVNELPIDGPLPTLADLLPRVSFPIALPVINDLPIVGPVPTVDDLPRRKRDAIAAPVVQDLPIPGNIPTFDQWVAAERTVKLGNWSTVRKTEYVSRFGPGSQVSPGPVDVCLHPPNSIRPVTTLVTCGMSNHTMKVPDGDWSPRAELVMYIAPDKMHPNYIELLRSLATVPAKYDRGFWYGSTMGNGTPTKPIFAGSVLDGFVFMIPNVRSDFQIRESLAIDQHPVQLLWVVPTTTAERQYLRQYGMGAFCQLLDKNDHLLVLDPNRSCFVAGEQQQAG